MCHNGEICARIHHAEELHEKLREQGIEKMTEVKSAFLEGDGQIRVIRNKSTDQRRPASAAPDIR